MISKTFKFVDPQGVEIYVYKWLPKNLKKAKGVVQIAHGMAEHASRYERFAQKLTAAGYIVYANDHRGHGKTAGKLENVGYFGDKDGFTWMVRDLYQLNGIIHNSFPKLPVFLFGHSMGSFLTQNFMESYKFSINGAILSGTLGPQGALIDFGLFLSSLIILFKGKKHLSKTLFDISMGSYNKSFRPNRTKFDWLSRDKKEVDKYVADPYCGGVFTAQAYHDLFWGIKDMHRLSRMRKISKDLPIYLFSGELDPVGSKTRTVVNLINIYNDLEIKNVSFKFYKKCHHETLNETNREEVMKDVIRWLNAQV